MENWGLVTYRETALLIDPENSSSHTKQWVALVVGHELAHQWFGNLVTMVGDLTQCSNHQFWSRMIEFQLCLNSTIFSGMVDTFVAKRRICIVD